MDKQTNHGIQAIADYWIVDFLKSDFTTTPATGTKRLALALKKASSNSQDPDVKREVVAAALLAANFPKNTMTIKDFCDHFHMSKATRVAVEASVSPALFNDKFKFDKDEFIKHISYKQVEMDSGAVLSAPVDKFEQCFEERQRNGIVTFSTSGNVVDQRLRKMK